MTHKIWWDMEGSGMRLLPNEDIEEFAKRITEIAWSNGAYESYPDGVDAEWIARRTKYAVEQEREACAKVCGRLADEALVVGDEDAVMCFEEAEDLIRARGEA